MYSIIDFTYKLKACIYILFLFLFFNINGQTIPKYEPPDTRILFIFDASQSMAGYWEKNRKIDIARKTLISIIDSLEHLENVSMALRLYGHQSPVPPQNCRDTRLEVPFGKNNAGQIRQELRFVIPKGTTPIAYSLKMGAEDFPADCDKCRNIIILITDGIEACDGDPCAESYELQRSGIVLKPFVIGIGIDEGFKETFDCIGHYYNAAREEKFGEVMEVVISQALNATTAQVNLLDIYGNPTETDINMTFYDSFSGRIIYNFIHTINNKGNPDTLILDHLITYKLRIHTIPPVDVDNIKLHVGKHTMIGADTPQGLLILKTADGQHYRDIQYIVRKTGDPKTLNMQDMYMEEKYLVGKYDIEVPVLPVIYLSDVEIKQSNTTTVEIPRPGILTLIKAASGFGSIYHRISNKQEEWVYNLNSKIKNESIVLQPGKYRVVYRAQNARLTVYTVNKTFEIKSGASIALQLY